jgi:uncharacterized protein (DUF2147 family)
LFVQGSELRGVIERVFLRAGEPPDPVCTQCRGDLRDKPILGLSILWGLHRERERWVGGSVLDPQNGKEYRARVWLEGPERLRVRGYWGPFFRTQTWRRLPPDSTQTDGGTPRP